MTARWITQRIGRVSLPRYVWLGSIASPSRALSALPVYNRTVLWRRNERLLASSKKERATPASPSWVAHGRSWGP
jgi:hypothetical protein